VNVSNGVLGFDSFQDLCEYLVRHPAFVDDERLDQERIELKLSLTRSSIDQSVLNRHGLLFANGKTVQKYLIVPEVLE